MTTTGHPAGRAVCGEVRVRGWGRVGVRRWGRVRVAGGSMSPALLDGDRCLVRWDADVAVGDVVVAERPDRPGLVVVKRASRREPDGWWLEGDHARASHDSWVFGAVPPASVRGRVVWRYRPLRRFGPVR